MISEISVPRFLRFKDLQERGLVLSHQGLRHLQIHENFPLGRLLGPSSRVWSETEVAAWLASRPVEPSRQTTERAARSVESRFKQGRLPTARQMIDAEPAPHCAKEVPPALGGAR
jgi:predicted DNA-binding transcriptional regulator AlpA